MSRTPGVDEALAVWRTLGGGHHDTRNARAGMHLTPRDVADAAGVRMKEVRRLFAIWQLTGHAAEEHGGWWRLSPWGRPPEASGGYSSRDLVVTHPDEPLLTFHVHGAPPDVRVVLTTAGTTAEHRGEDVDAMLDLRAAEPRWDGKPGAWAPPGGPPPEGQGLYAILADRLSDAPDPPVATRIGKTYGEPGEAWRDAFGPAPRTPDAPGEIERIGADLQARMEASLRAGQPAPSGDGPAAPPSAPATLADAERAAACIRSWSEVLRSLSTVAEAQLMESAWTIRRACPARADFNAFVGERLAGVLAPDRAWAMAETWEVARTQKALRDAAVRQPVEAMTFVRQIVEEGMTDALTADDERVVEILAAPPRLRSRRIRALVEAERAGPGRSADDVERIERLERQVETLTTRAQDAAGDARRQAIEDLSRLGAELADAAGRIGAFYADASPPDAFTERLLHEADAIQAALDRIAGAPLARQED